jgi:hypothetical protein
MLEKLFLITYFSLLISINGKVIIPFKYISEKTQSVQTPKEIMDHYLKEKINLNLEIGTPKQEVQIPISFITSDIYIVEKDHLRENSINNKIFDNKKSSSLNILSTDIEYCYSDDYSMYQDSNDIFHFMKDIKGKEYSEIKMNFRLAFITSTNDPGRFGLQIYSKDEDDSKVPCPLRILFENKINDNYLWSIHFNKKENQLEDEGYLLLGEYPHDLEKSIGIYDTYEFNKDNYKSIYDISNSKTMNNEIQMSVIYFYNKEDDKDSTNQKDFNNLQSSDLFQDIIIPQVTLSYVTKFDFNFGGILIPEFFNAYIKQKVFDDYIKQGKCFIESAFAGLSINYYYCKKEKSVINKIKDKIPTVIFSQAHLIYNFTIGINELLYEKDDYVFFLLFYSGSQRNKWILGKPFLKKYPLVFNPDSKDIGFYSSFLLTGIRYRTVIIVAVVLSVVFIIIGLLIGRKRCKIYKIQKQKALEMSMSNNEFTSNYKSIELNSNDDGNKLYKK